MKGLANPYIPRAILNELIVDSEKNAPKLLDAID